MKILGWDVTRTPTMAPDRTHLMGELDLTKAKTGGSTMTEVEKRVKEFMDSDTRRSATSPVGVEDIGFKARQQLYYSRRARLDNLYTIAFAVTPIRASVINIRNEIFRRGFDTPVPKFAKICMNPDCLSEFDHQVSKCPNCVERNKEGIVTKEWDTRDPDPQQLKYFMKFMIKANDFDQSLEDVCRECEDDVNIVDDGFMLMVKEYFFNVNDKEPPVKERMKQILRLDPCNIEFDLDANGMPERAHYVCIMHRRDEASSNVVAPGYQEFPQVAVPESEKVQAAEIAPVCPECGRQMYPAMYRYLYRGKYRFYIRKEVIHWSRYAPSKTYGYSPILSVYEKALTMLGMDRWLYDYFYERIIPPGVIVTVTDDPLGLEQRIKDQEMKLRENPHHIAWVAVSKRTGQGKTEYIRFGSNFQEMDFQNISDRIGDFIAGMWGVSRIFMGSPAQVGGRDTSTNQLVVMGRVVESAQKSWNLKVLPKIIEAFGVTDFVIRLAIPEEKTEMLLLEERQAKTAIAMQMAQMGFAVSLDDRDQFVFSRKPVPPPTPPVTAAAPGGPGGPGGAPPPPAAGGPEGAPPSPEGQDGEGGGVPEEELGEGGPTLEGAREGEAATPEQMLEKLPAATIEAKATEEKPTEKKKEEVKKELELALSGVIKKEECEILDTRINKNDQVEHRHKLQDHPGYEGEWHLEDQKHRTGEHAEPPEPDKPWWEEKGVTVDEDKNNFKGKIGEHDVEMGIGESGDGFAVTVKHPKYKNPGVMKFPKERDARTYIEEAYKQGSLEPKIDPKRLSGISKSHGWDIYRGNRLLGHMDRNGLVNTTDSDLIFKVSDALLNGLGGVRLGNPQYPSELTKYFGDAGLTIVPFDLVKAGLPEDIRKKIEGKLPKGAKKFEPELLKIIKGNYTEELNKFLGDLTPEMTEGEVQDRLNEFIKRYTTNTVAAIAPISWGIYETGLEAGMKDTAVALGAKAHNLGYNWIIKNPNGILEAAKGLGREQHQAIAGVIRDAFKGEIPFSLPTMKKKVKEVGDIAGMRAELIVRTEISKISNEGRLLAWEQDPNREEYFYWWVSTADERRKAISKVFDDNGPYTFEQIKTMWRTPTTAMAQSMGLKGSEGLPVWMDDTYRQRCSLVRTPKGI